MKIPHEKFCVLPWISLEASPIGSVRPCCLAEEEIVNDAGQKFDLNTADLGEVQHSRYMQKLRQDFLDSKQPRTCRKCWNEERSGRTSKRMHTLDRLKHIIQDETWDADAKPLQFLDLKLGNICNLKCRICGSWSSSTFAAEELQYIPNEQKKSSFHYTMLRRGAWPRENPVFWQQMDHIVQDIRYIEFTGGEPFMIREHFDLLQSIVDRGIAHQVEIHYNTNGTQWPDHAESIWQHFRAVEIAFSIDDLGSRFEYQRTNAVWSEVEQNIQRFRDLRERCSNIQLQVCSTVNVFNVMYLESLAQWIDQQAFDFVYWNMMHEAYYFSIGTLPDSAKSVAMEKLRAANVSSQHYQEFQRIQDFMQQGASLDGNILKMKIQDLDWRRNTDLRTHHPELATAIGYAGP
jgi:MoaA/NifB/PqqE/SkfB family radical SAM enzyme